MAGSLEPRARPWLVDAGTGEVAFYDTLFASIAEMRSIRPLCQPATAREAVEEIVRAAAAGTRLTMLDSTLSRKEIERLGFDVAAINVETPCEARHSVTSFPGWLAGAANPNFALELLTSGSTGLPGRVAHTLETLGRAVRVSKQHADDIWALAYPATHVAGVQVVLQAMRNGNTLVDVTMLRGDETAEAIICRGVTHISATPTYYRMLVATRRTMPAVRAVTLGGEPADEALLTALREIFPQARLRNVYASTEAGTVFESEGELFSVPGALADHVRIADGRILLHRSLLGKFSERSDLSSTDSPQPLTSAATASGWYDTGDSVEIVSTAPLRFKITGRRQEWVNVGGDKVNPREVEEVLRSHPAVLDAAVAGRANSVSGALLHADVVLRGAPITETELRAFAGARLQPFKVPRIIRFVPSLNSTYSGKLLRR